MAFSVTRSDLFRVELQTRMPFRYGIATMTQMPMVFVRVYLADGDQETVGLSSDLLPPKWFTKVPAKPPEEEIEEMMSVISHAQTAVLALQGKSVFDLWRQLYNAQEAWAKSQQLPPLLAHFGTSLLERAIIDAACRARHTPLHLILRTDALDADLASVQPSLANSSPRQFLSDQPPNNVLARHTIGLGDPLTDEQIPAEERLHDGLPQSLQACIRHYGLRHFKIKLSGRPAEDLDRLQQIESILTAETKDGYAFSLDGNEQFQSMEAFQDFWEQLRAHPPLKAFQVRLLFVEQPVHRSQALQPNVGTTLRRWTTAPALIIDESDGELGDARLALELGYSGTSHKNCKGVFKGLANCCLLAQRKRMEPGRTWIMSGEDLCNMGPIALLQDLAVMGALGIESVERNGHHYNAGLSQFPARIREAVLEAHPDLYRRSELQWPTLKIEQGRISLDSINRAPFGVNSALTETVSAWMSRDQLPE